MKRTLAAASFCTLFGAFLLCCPPDAYALPPIDACSLLTQEQVSAALGVNVDAAKRLAPTMCGWSAPNQPNSVNAKKVALLISNPRAFAFAKTPPVSSEKAAPAKGVCDDAVYSFPAQGPTTNAAIPKPGDQADGADEEPCLRSADGDRCQLQQ